MILTPNQIQEVLQIIERNHLVYTLVNVGVSVLSDYEKKILRNYGIDVSKINQSGTPYDRAYYWGKLSQQLAQQAGNVEYKDFLQYMRKGQYRKLTPQEQQQLDIAKQRSYSHIKSLNDTIKSQFTQLTTEQAQKIRLQREKVVSDEVKQAIIEKKSLSDLGNSIGKRIGDWSINYGRIADTEMQAIYNEGRIAEIQEQYGEDAEIYKRTFEGACRHCISLHLTSGVGSKPVIKPLKEIVGNGSNIGRKVADWKFTVPPEHPYCRCEVEYKDPKTVWSQEEGRFIYPKTDRVRERPRARLVVGDKEFMV
jgi:hypothetical protein